MESKNYTEKNNKNIEKVVTGKVVSKEKSKGHKFLGLFLNEDIPSVKEYVIYDLLVPIIKDGLVDILQKGTEMLFYGQIKSSKPKNGYVQYTNYSKNDRPRASFRRGSIDVNDIFLETRAEAEQVLDTLIEIVDKYGEATVADLYRAVGVTGNGYTDQQFGWMDMRGAYVSRTRNGYLLNLPRPIDLE